MTFRKALLTLTLLLPVAASGNEKVIDVVTSEYPPYEYMKGDKVVGTDTRVIREVLDEMGYTANIRVLPWARAESLVRAGEADMLFSLTYSDERNRHYYFTDPISEAEDVFFKQTSRDLQWQTLEDLEGLSFGLTASYSYAPEFMDWLLNGNARVTRITQEQPELTGLRLVSLGRIDLFICEKSVCEYLLEENSSRYPELSQVDQMPGIVGPVRSFRAAFSRKLPNGKKLRDEFNDALASVSSKDIH
ncbi:transporter substrate-binding domain-containing protein [Marinobacter sp. CHS3-4]|uniref:substrate-binding periplasmic protein n=1 Tax=Marinobacter sp. CHS3-4 TaxID=3045174 RepID=UPI0024B5D5F9|nr:transporter substrate-binding domain-containing protein [Marinobacter sp. CHS3-4]MDI9244207.1 transporter substrate-binding domain-containing protein [Marinobacter sp. CHS3-4]